MKGGFDKPLHGATDTHDTQRLEMNMAELELVAQHLSSQTVVGCQRIQPAYDDLIQALIQSEIAKVLRVERTE